jgi:hypothetical protein
VALSPTCVLMSQSIICAGPACGASLNTEPAAGAAPAIPRSGQRPAVAQAEDAALQPATDDVLPEHYRRAPSTTR